MKKLFLLMGILIPVVLLFWLLIKFLVRRWKARNVLGNI